MSRKKHTGFTLIELLVVIAIIAILAAILFPVFAQARQAARGASSQSNLKQLSLGILMYIQDNDETFPPDIEWTVQGPINIGGPVVLWGWEIVPYLKNGQIFGDPLTAPPSQQPASLWWPYLTQYGYNYTALSPHNSPTWPCPVATPATMAGLNRPAELVMLAGHATYADYGNVLWWWGYNVFTTTLGIVDPPDCWHIVPWCIDNWGVDSWYATVALGGNKEKGAFTGGVSLRKQENANVSLVDGHAKFMNPGAAAVGTNWNFNLPVAQLYQTDPTKYMWAPQP
jgi:prepilin-type N-terminal cleavage/methylation domain-containing protein